MVKKMERKIDDKDVVALGLYISSCAILFAVSYYLTHTFSGLFDWSNVGSSLWAALIGGLFLYIILRKIFWRWLYEGV